MQYIDPVIFDPGFLNIIEDLRLYFDYLEPYYIGLDGLKTLFSRQPMDYVGLESIRDLFREERLVSQKGFLEVLNDLPACTSGETCVAGIQFTSSCSLGTEDSYNIIYNSLSTSFSSDLDLGSTSTINSNFHNISP